MLTRAGHSHAPTTSEVQSFSSAASAASTALTPGRRYEIYNNGAIDICVRWSSSSPTAVTTDLRLKAGAIFVWDCDTPSQYVAAISQTGASTTWQVYPVSNTL